MKLNLSKNTPISYKFIILEISTYLENQNVKRNRPLESFNFLIFGTGVYFLYYNIKRKWCIRFVGSLYFFFHYFHINFREFSIHRIERNKFNIFN